MLKQSLVREDGIVLKWVILRYWNLFMATRNVQKWYTWSCPSKKWEDGHLLISFVAMCVIHRHGMGTEYTTSRCGRQPYHGKCADFQTSWFLFCGHNLAGTQTRCGIGIPKTSQVRIWCSDTFDLDWSPCAVLIRLLFRVPGTSSLSINASKHKRTKIGRAETASSNHWSKMTDDSTLLSLKVGVLNRGNNTSTNSSIKPWLGRWWWKPNMASWPNAPDLLAKCDDRQQWHTSGACGMLGLVFCETQDHPDNFFKGPSLPGQNAGCSVFLQLVPQKSTQADSVTAGVAQDLLEN